MSQPICITDFQRQKLIAAGYDAKKITVIPNSIDAPASYQQSIGNYVAYIGRLSFEKGYDLLVEVARRNPSIQIRFAGAKREQTDIKIPENVQFMGYLQDGELANFIRQSRFVVMPSRCYEGFPMAILEAACYGKPTIGPAHGGFTEIIGRGDSSIGKLFEPNNLDDLERQIVALWNAPDEITQLGQKAFEKLQREYSSEVIYKKWDSLFQGLV